VSVVLSAGLSILVFFGGLGETIQPYSPVVAVLVAFLATPVLGMATRGRYYLRRTDDGLSSPYFDGEGNPSGEVMTCHVCRQPYERPDMVACATHDAAICSLCLSIDSAADHVLAAEPRSR
jgi:hypothetical protein